MQEALSDEVAVLLLADIVPSSKLWGWSRIVIGPRLLRGVPCLRFAKLLGSGYEGGFGLRPSGSRQGVFAVFSNLRAAEEFVAHSELAATYRQRCNELCIAMLRTWSCRGAWDGTALSLSAAAPVDGPVAALTRASIALRKAPSFWSYAPAAQTALEAAPGVQLAVGLGEAPFLRQATFSVWDSVAAMDAYARGGAHRKAIEAAARQQFFSESMFARFVPLRITGTWKGRHYG
jgi:hypothetical protein